MTDTEIEVSFLMPCLNEARSLGACIRKAQQSIAALKLSAEIVIADNGSTDGSQRIAEDLGARVVSIPEKGYGAALIGGVAAARGKFVIMADADDSYDWSDVGGFIERLRAGDELVMGCRLPSGGGRILKGAMPWQNRWIGNPALSTIGRLFFRAPVSDFHCGMRGFNRQSVLNLDLITTGMEFASEMVIKATLRKLRITQIPITLHPDGRGGRPPHLNRWRDGWRHLRFMLLFCPKWLFFIPGALLFFVGLLGGARLLAGPAQIAGIEFSTNTLLICSMSILLGFQLLTVAMFTKVFSASVGLMPDDSFVRKFSRAVSLEAGVLSGVALIVVGIALLAWSVEYWRLAGFGELSYQTGLRRVIPAVTTITLGTQIVIASFFLGVLRLPRK